MSDLKEIVGEEGLDARNVLSWRVPHEPSPKTPTEKSNLKDESSTKSESRPKRPKSLNVLTTPSETASDTYSEDENAKMKCSEAAELFERCKRDFEKLSERIDEQKRFEMDQAGGVSWEVRKTALGTRRTSESLPEDGGDLADNFSLAHDLSAASLGKSGSASSFVSAASKSSPVTASKSASKLRATAAPFQPKVSDTAKLSLEIPSPAQVSPGQEDEEIQEEVQARDAIYAQIEAWVEAEAQAEDAAWLQMEMEELHTEQGSSVLEPERTSTPTDKDEEVATSRDPPSWSLLWTPTGAETSSTFSSPAMPRSLHEKLSSPDRRKLTPLEAKQRQEARQIAADELREKNVEEKRQKAMIASTRQKEREKNLARRAAQAQQQHEEKLREAERRHTEYIKSVRGKAGNENNKVSEVMFINSLNEMGLNDELRMRLHEAEARIEAGRLRRQEFLDGISSNQKKKHQKKAQQMSEKRLKLEQEKMERVNKLQKQIESVEERRNQRLLELHRRRVALEAHREKSQANEATQTGDMDVDVADERQDQVLNKLTKKQKKKAKAAASLSLNDDEYLDSLIAKQDNITGNVLSDVRDELLSEDLRDSRVAALMDGNSIHQQLEEIVRLNSNSDSKLHLLLKFLYEISLQAPPKKAKKKHVTGEGIALCQALVANAVQFNNLKQLFTDTPKDQMVEFFSSGGLLLVRLLLDIHMGAMRDAASLKTLLSSGVLENMCVMLMYVTEKMFDDILRSGIFVPLFDLLHYLNSHLLAWSEKEFAQLIKKNKAKKGKKSRDVQALNISINWMPEHHYIVRLLNVINMFLQNIQLNASLTIPIAWCKYTFDSDAVVIMSNILKNVLPVIHCVQNDRYLYQLVSNYIVFVGMLFDNLKRLYEINLNDEETRTMLIGYTSTVESMDLVPNLVFIVSALLLRDGSRRHNDHNIHPVVLSVSGEILWVLNTIGRMNLSLVQKLPIELQSSLSHIADRLISTLLPVIDKKQSASAITQTDDNATWHPTISTDRLETFIEFLLEYMGHFCLKCPANQDTMALGPPPSMLVRLCNLPVKYFSQDRLKSQLFSTLLSLIYGNENTRSIVQNEMNTELLVEHLQNAKQLLMKNPSAMPQHFQLFSLKFPSIYWDDAIAFLCAA